MKLKSAAAVFFVLTIALTGVHRLGATILYATSVSGNEIDRVDTVGNTVTTFLNTPSGCDSLLFDLTGRVIYSQLYTGEVRLFDPSNNTDITIASGFNVPVDMVLEPGGASILVSEFFGGKIDRISLSNYAVTPLAPQYVPAGPEGLAYAGSSLFANLGLRSNSAQKYVAQLDPVSGNILATSPALSSLDGLTFDPYSGRLFATSLYGNTVYSINPNNLNDVIDVLASLNLSVPGPDGITSDGLGNIFIASSDGQGDSHVYQLDLINSTLTQRNLVPGLDDLAPLLIVPEPSASSLFVVGLAALALIVMVPRRRLRGL